jgi:hypothetical protein
MELHEILLTILLIVDLSVCPGVLNLLVDLGYVILSGWQITGYPLGNASDGATLTWLWCEKYEVLCDEIKPEKSCY